MLKAPIMCLNQVIKGLDMYLRKELLKRVSYLAIGQFKLIVILMSFKNVCSWVYVREQKSFNN